MYKCTECPGSHGILIMLGNTPMDVQRCDVCRRFASDYDAALVAVSLLQRVKPRPVAKRSGRHLAPYDNQIIGHRMRLQNYLLTTKVPEAHWPAVAEALQGNPFTVDAASSAVAAQYDKAKQQDKAGCVELADGSLMPYAEWYMLRYGEKPSVANMLKRLAAVET